MVPFFRHGQLLQRSKTECQNQRKTNTAYMIPRTGYFPHTAHDRLLTLRRGWRCAVLRATDYGATYRTFTHAQRTSGLLESRTAKWNFSVCHFVFFPPSFLSSHSRHRRTGSTRRQKERKNASVYVFASVRGGTVSSACFLL